MANRPRSRLKENPCRFRPGRSAQTYQRLLAGGETKDTAGAADRSVLGQFFETLRRAEVELETARADALSARAVYQAALKTLKDATATGLPVNTADLDKLVAALQELRKATAILGAVQQLAGVWASTRG